MAQQPTAFVTGGTAGIGRAIAFALGRAGWQVGLCARSAEAVTATVAALQAEGITAAGSPADVGVEQDVTRAIGAIESQLGPIELLVNNAGIMRTAPIMELSLADWDQTMATNVRALFLTTRTVLPGMRRLGRGTIVNIASLAGKNGFAGGTAYTASKHAVLGFSKSLMMEVRTEGIRAIAICPGSVETALRRGGPARRPNADRILQPEDVASMVLAALALPDRALVSELDIRPNNP
jgi:3-oxoacyl-[acyl-carrier protein] reductase